MSLIEEIVFDKKNRRIFCILFCTICILCVLFAIVGFLGLAKCSCDLSTAPFTHHTIEVPVNYTTSATNPNIQTPLLVNYTTSANCSHGLSLGSYMFVHICWYNNEALIDIRQFIGRRPTIKGIGLRKQQWNKLLLLNTTINKYIQEKEFIHRIFKYSDWYV